MADTPEVIPAGTPIRPIVSATEEWEEWTDLILPDWGTDTDDPSHD